jgi:hypothetical protein
MSPKKRLDKRLYAAKIVGILLLVISIIGFFSNIFAALMSMFMFPEIDHINQVNENRHLFPEFIGWIFSHYTVLALSFSVVWIPMFLGARALNKFKEWGRVVSLVMLFFLMLMLVIMTIFMSLVSEVPLLFRLWLIFVYIIYIAHPAVGAYFLMRRSTREGIREYNTGINAIAETAPPEFATVETATVETIPAPSLPPTADPRYELAKQVVADVRNLPLPTRKRKAALIIAGIMMIAFPALWAFLSFIIMLSTHGWQILLFALSVLESIASVWMGIMTIAHLKKYRLMAFLITFVNMILIIATVHTAGAQAVLLFMGYYVAILVMLIVNYDKFFDDQDEENETPHVKESGLQELEMQELNALLTSKNSGEINEEEFEKKTIEIKVKYRTLDMAESLQKRKNNGMLSEEEYQTKLNQLLIEKTEEVTNEMHLEKEKQQRHAQRLSQIPTERIEKLTLPNQKKLEKYIDILEPGDIIVFHDHQIKLFRAERWAAINEANTQGEFEVILQL